jgi:hypothetical protein
MHTRCTGFPAISCDGPPRSGCVGTSRPQTSRRDAVLSARRSTFGAAVKRQSRPRARRRTCGARVRGEGHSDSHRGTDVRRVVLRVLIFGTVAGM